METEKTLDQVKDAIGSLRNAYAQLPIDSASRWSTTWDRARLEISRTIRTLQECEAVLKPYSR